MPLRFLPATCPPLAPHLNLRALLPGLAIGLVLVALEVLSFALLPAIPDNALTMLLRALFIYLPTGALIGWHARHQPGFKDSHLLPPAVHALLGGVVLAPVHAFILLITNAGLAPSLEWFLAESILAALLAMLAGALTAMIDAAG